MSTPLLKEEWDALTLRAKWDSLTQDAKDTLSAKFAIDTHKKLVDSFSEFGDAVLNDLLNDAGMVDVTTRFHVLRLRKEKLPQLQPWYSAMPVVSFFYDLFAVPNDIAQVKEMLATLTLVGALFLGWASSFATAMDSSGYDEVFARFNSSTGEYGSCDIEPMDLIVQYNYYAAQADGNLPYRCMLPDGRPRAL